jgi:Protein of unknown function, DUF547
MFTLLPALTIALAVFGWSITPALAAEKLEQRFAAHTAGAKTVVDHAAWDGLVKTYVVPGADGVNRVDYAAFKAKGHGALKTYIAMLEATDVGKLDRPEQFAFWANLYNAKTIDAVLSKYPVKSIKDVSLGGGLKALVGGGPWQAKIMKVGGIELSLDDIEHGILRPVFKDPRVHYSVNCASFGCPNLPNAAFTGATLEAMLEAGAKAYVNHPRGVRIEAGKATASSIYSWFQADFGGSDKAVIDHMRKYAAPELASKLSTLSAIASYDYDWSLNDIKR